MAMKAKASVDVMIGANLAKLRKSRGLTQMGLVALMGEYGFDNFLQNTVSRIEKGKRPVHLSEALALAKIFGSHTGPSGLVPSGCFDLVQRKAGPHADEIAELERWIAELKADRR
jgi:transcriptional regulator with XRE-family HTH domain